MRIPVNLLRAIEAFLAVFIPEKAEIKTKYFCPSIT